MIVNATGAIMNMGGSVVVNRRSGMSECGRHTERQETNGEELTLFH